MLARLQMYLHPPVFEDEEKTRIARFLHTVILSAQACGILYFLLAFPLRGLRTGLPFVLVGILYFAGIQLLIRTGYIKFASRLFVGGTWLLLTLFTIAEGGIGSPVFAAYILVVISAGLLSGARAGLAATILCIFTGAGILYAQTQNLFPVISPTPSTIFIIESMIFIVGSTMLVYFNRDLKAALLISRRSADELQRAHQSLRASEEKYRGLFNNVPAGLYRTAPDGIILEANPALIEMLGFRDRDALVGLNASALYAEPVDNDAWLAEARQNTMIRSLNVKFQKADGSILWADDYTRVIQDKAGNVQYFEGSVVDITERKQAETALREAEAKYRALVERLPVVVYTSELGVEGKWTYVSPQIESLLGFTPEEWMADATLWYRQVHPEDRDRQEDVEEQAWARKEAFDAEYRIRTRAGREIWIRDSAQILPPSNSGAPIVQGILMDVTERKHNEAQLRKLSRAVEQSSASIVITDAEGIIEYVNPYFSRLTGYSLEEAAGNTPRILKSGLTDEQEYVDLWRTVKEGQEWRGELCNRKKNGELYWESVSISPVTDERGRITHLISVKEDITERKQAREELQRQEQVLRLFVEHSPAAIAMFDRDMRYIIASHRYLIDYGLGERNLVGHSHYEVFPEIPERWKEIHRRCLAGATERADADPFPRANGKLDWVRWEIHPWYEATGEIGGIILFSEVITGRMEAQAALRESQARLQLFFNQSLDGFFFSMLDEPKEWNDSVDKEKVLEYVLVHQHITEANEAMIRQYGATSEKFLGRTASDFFAHDLAQGREFRRKLFDAGHLHMETEERKDSGEAIWIEGDYVCMYDDEGRITGMFGIQRDITERKRAEERLRTQLERLASLRAIDTAISTSTDLRMTFYILLTQAVSKLKIDAAAILLHDAVTNSFTFGGAQGFRTTEIQKARIRMGEGIAGRAAFERAPLEGHLLTLEEFSTDSPHLAGEGFTCFYAIPLFIKGRVVGILEVFERQHRAHDRDWVDFVNTLAGQAAIAIDNSSLFSNLQRTNDDLRHAYETTLEGWSRALDLRDQETEGHTQRVTYLTERIAEAMNISGEELLNIRRGALLHDIGKMGVPDKILHKRGPLTEKEWEDMRQHPQFAFELLAPIVYLHNALDIPYCHHEKWDGSGYPRGLKGEQIPLAARIFAVADVYDALTSDRPYRKGWDPDKALEYIREQSGSHFDPRIVQIFMQEVAGQSY